MISSYLAILCQDALCPLRVEIFRVQKKAIHVKKYTFYGTEPHSLLYYGKPVLGTCATFSTTAPGARTNKGGTHVAVAQR